MSEQRSRQQASSDEASHPPYLYPDYKSTRTRAPAQLLITLERGESENSVADFSTHLILPVEADLTRQSNGEPIGERIVIAGRVTDEDGSPVRHSLIEIWQCNAAGRYTHAKDTHDAPLDPHFRGFGKALTDSEGHYRFVTVKPGAYPWKNHPNAWRPAHVHFSLFGNTYAQRLVTQMFFPGDPLLALDPIYQSVPHSARDRLIAQFDINETLEEVALGYRFDIVLRGRGATPFDSGS